MIHVTSEVGRLRRVLLHEPGLEVDRMVPAMMDDLLFDDVLFGDRAREEHALFRRVLQLLGVDVVEADDLLAATLAVPEAREWLLRLIRDGLPPGLAERMDAASGAELAEMLVAGVLRDGSTPAERHDSAALGGPDEAAPGALTDELFQLTPVPNWCFQRDPQVVLGDGVIFSAMAAPARYREALLARAVFRFHPELGPAPVLHDPLQASADDPLFMRPHRPRLEGGDVLVLAPDVLAVGLSERTNPTAVMPLARALAGRDGGPRWLFLVEIPKRRAYMHLDTLITPVDADACLVYPPVILAGGREQAAVHEIDLHASEPAPRPCGDLLAALRVRGVNLEPIPCGGDDPVRQQREQWTDGANALALAPGVITLYDRNVGTAEELARRGFTVVAAKDLLLGRTEVDLAAAGRVCILMPSHEISRARGGPHCLSHPLERDEVA